MHVQEEFLVHSLSIEMRILTYCESWRILFEVKIKVDEMFRLCYCSLMCCVVIISTVY